jgi:hypothetical protein
MTHMALFVTEPQDWALFTGAMEIVSRRGCGAKGGVAHLNEKINYPCGHIRHG